MRPAVLRWPCLAHAHAQRPTHTPGPQVKRLTELFEKDAAAEAFRQQREQAAREAQKVREGGSTAPHKVERLIARMHTQARQGAGAVSGLPDVPTPASCPCSQAGDADALAAATQPPGEDDPQPLTEEEAAEKERLLQVDSPGVRKGA